VRSKWQIFVASYELRRQVAHNRELIAKKQVLYGCET